MHDKSLQSSDILERQDDLCKALRRYFYFSGHTLYFPTNAESSDPHYITREHKLLLPLLYHRKMLGMLCLHGLKARAVKPLIPYLPLLTEQILETLAVAKELTLDSETGLGIEEEFYRFMAEEYSYLKDETVANNDIAAIPAYRLCRGLVIVRLYNGDELGLRCGHAFLRTLLLDFGRILKDSLPADALAIRFGRYELGILLGTTGREKCRTLAEALLKKLLAVKTVNPLTAQPVYPVLAAAYAYYPYDMRPEELQLPVEEQSYILRQRVSLALDAASPEMCLGVHELLLKGGRILEALPLSRFRINLGRQMGVQAGQHFAIYGVGDARRFKGECSVVQTRKKHALAELVFQEDPAFAPEAGDRLELLLPGEREKNGQFGRNLYATLPEKTRQLALFSFVFLHCESKTKEALNTALLFEEWQSLFGGEEAVFDEHGPNLFVALHPGKRAEELSAPYILLAQKLAKERITLSVGIAGYPYLSFHRADIRDCASKTLEYARLLDEPKVGVCNSLAFTISADKLYSLGDLFGALEEYKLALLADRDNALAWNSMGVCMAAMGRKEEGRRHFVEALARAKNNEEKAQICYNLGTISQSLGMHDEARNAYTDCVNYDPGHLYALIRLGQLAERVGNRQAARKLYERAAAIEDAGGSSNTMAKRYLAGVAARQNRGDEARTLLQEALRDNPKDAAAMLMLASLYLDRGENPEIAETLARKSVVLEERPEAWQVMAQALRAMGREDDACQAEARAYAPLTVPERQE